MMNTYPIIQSTTARIRQATSISRCSAADFDSCAKSAKRPSKNSASALRSASRFSSNPACPAGLRDRELSFVISETGSELTPENQAQYKSDSERGTNRLCRIFANVLLCVVLEGPGALPRIAPCLFRLAAVFSGHSARCRFQILSRSARVFLAALQFVLRPCGGWRLLRPCGGGRLLS